MLEQVTFNCSCILTQVQNIRVVVKDVDVTAILRHCSHRHNVCKSEYSHSCYVIEKY